ncbi:hypothetical protein ED5_0145 [Enterobacter roggenkampii]|nr:hypothetical protein ED5_0145 [Enterobacter roggenkampii]
MRNLISNIAIKFCQINDIHVFQNRLKSIGCVFSVEIVN